MTTASYPVVGTSGRGVFSVTIQGEFFRGVARVHRLGQLEDTEVYLLEVVDKHLQGVPEPAWWNQPYQEIAVPHPGSKFFDERGREVQLPAGTHIPSLATESDYYGRIMPLLRTVERLEGVR